ncbi:MAG: S8 family serine peptidase [Promethearchaeota archaeon]
MKKNIFKQSRSIVVSVALLVLFLLPITMSTARAIPTTTTSTSHYEMNDNIPVQNWDVKTVSNDFNIYDASKLDGLLANWVDTNILPEGIITEEKKASIVLLTTGSDNTFGGLVEPLGSIVLTEKVSLVQALVSNLNDLKRLSLDSSVKMIQANEILKDAPIIPEMTLKHAERGHEMEVNPIIDRNPEDFAPPIDVFSTRDLIGATYVQDDLHYNGTTSVINVQDSGVDLGHTGFTGAELIDSNGDPMSLDPSGRGMAISQFVSYDFWGDPAFLDPLHTDANGDIDISAIKDYLVVFKPDYNSFGYGYGSYFPDLYHVGNLPGNTTGFAFGIVSSINGYQSFTSAYVPFILADGNDDGNYDTLYLDFDAGYQFTRWWYYLISDDDYLAIDWNFEDESPKTNGGDIQLAADLENETAGYGFTDGFNDFSVGGLASSLDHIYNISENAIPVVKGINANGRVFAHMWDYEGHGTSCAANALGRSVSYEVFKNAGINKTGTYDLKGIAPGAKLIATKGYSEMDAYYGWSWSAGFEPVDENNTWEFNPNCGHIANVSSNSWGYSDFHYNELVGGYDFTTMLMDYLSVPGYLDPSYQGLLMLTSSGNGGPGTGTNRQGGQSALALMVGASTNSWIRQLWGYPYEDQPADQIIGWSDAGPNDFGYPTLDVVNVGAFDFSLTPVDWIRPARDGGYYNYDYFGGTSQACPMTAGVMGLIYDAWSQSHSTPLNPMVAKTILKSTAKDLGYDVYHQGNGRADAREAVSYIIGNTDANGDEILHAITNESIKNVVDRFEYAYQSYFDEEHPAITNETFDGSLYGGAMVPGDTKNVKFTIDGNSSNVDIADFAMKTLYTEQNDSMTTYAHYSDFNITDTFNMANLLNADFFQLTAGINFTTSDWLDVNGTRQPIMYVQGFDGENRTFINYAYNHGNMQTLFMPTDFLKNTGDFKIQIRIRDFGWNTYGENWTGLPISMAIRVFNRTDDVHMSVSDLGLGVLQATIDTTGQIPGTYGGFVVINSTDNNQLLVPYGYSVIANVSEMNDNGWTEISGLTDRLNDNGMYGAIDWGWRPDTGDWRYFDFVFNKSGFTDQDPNTLLLEVNWTLPGSAIDCWVVDASGYVVGMTDYQTAGGKYLSYVNTPDSKGQRLLIDMSGFVDGTWTQPYENYTNSGMGWDLFSLVLHSSAFDLADDLLALQPFTIKMSWINDSVSAFNTPTVHYSVTGGLNYNGVMTTDGNLTVGWTDADNSYGYETDVYDVFIYPGREINIYETVSATDHYYYVDLNAGDFATMSFGWDQPETDLDFFLYDPNGVEVAYAASLANPEIIQYYVTESGEYEIEVDYYDGPGTPYNTAYDIVIQSPGEKYLYEDIETGTDLLVDLATIDVAEGQYFVETNTYGWNFDYEDRTTFIYDISAPVFAALDDISYEVATTGHTITWNPTDLTPDNYKLYIDGSLNSSGAWDGSSLTFDIDGLVIGTHNYTLSLEDVLGHVSSDTVIVTVTNQIPTITSPGDVSIVFGTENKNIAWTVSDISVNNPTYSISVNGVVNTTGTWVPGVGIYLPISGWAVGSYEVIITALDGYGGSVSDTVNVIVASATTIPSGIPGYSTTFLILASLGIVAILIKKRK